MQFVMISVQFNRPTMGLFQCLHKLQFRSLGFNIGHARGLGTLPSAAQKFPGLGIVSNVGAKLKNSLGMLEYPKYRLLTGSYTLYEGCVDNIKCEEFMNYLNLEDSFFSWFRIVELHLWMCMARVMEEGKDGRFVRNHIVEAMWLDIHHRLKKLVDLPASIRKREMLELGDHFQAALCIYDEGIRSNDKVLTGALWQRLLAQGNPDISKLETLVEYTRKNCAHLQELDRCHMLTKGTVKWLPLHTMSRF